MLEIFRVVSEPVIRSKDPKDSKDFDNEESRNFKDGPDNEGEVG